MEFPAIAQEAIDAYKQQVFDYFETPEGLSEITGLALWTAKEIFHGTRQISTHTQSLIAKVTPIIPVGDYICRQKRVTKASNVADYAKRFIRKHYKGEFNIKCEFNDYHKRYQLEFSITKSRSDGEYHLRGELQKQLRTCPIEGQDTSNAVVTFHFRNYGGGDHHF